MEYKSNITSEEIKLLDLKQYEGQVLIVPDKDNLETALEILQNQPFIGFDTETRPAFKKGTFHSVALLQLAVSDTAILIRLNKISLPKEIKQILSDNRILKIGAAIRDDIKALQKLHTFKPAGFVELQDFVQKYGILDFSIKKMAAIVLNMRISKRQQLSNWENPELAEAQIRYAATDAWICYEVYKKLTDK